MICAACGEPNQDQQADVCGACGADPLLAGRYRLLGTLGHGGVATTYEAEQLSDGVHVAIKELLLRRMDAFKTKDLFHREAQVLRTLDHPGIPRYIDELTAGSGKHMAFYLVQELVRGQNLQAELSDKRQTEREVAATLAELAEILSYLHSLRPPVIHRDLKPSNVMRREADSKLMLIDFGAVREAATTRGQGGSTVAGTFGFMAPEQFAGQASPATDLYGLGTTAVALLTHRSPQELLDATHELRWREVVSASPALTAILEELLVRDPAHRASDAAEVGRRLQAVADGTAPAFSPTGSWSAKPQPKAEPGRPILGGATLKEVMRGEVPVGDLIESLRDGSLLRGGPRQPPDLYLKPPPAPRPSGLWLARKRDAVAGFKFMFGAIFGGVGTIVGVPLVLTSLFGAMEPLAGLIGGGLGVIFAAIGGVVGLSGLQRLQQISALWQDGHEVIGHIEHIEMNRQITVNGRSPWQVHYTYRVHGRPYSGSGTTFDRKMRRAQRGQPVAVVFDPNNPGDSVVNLPS
ncbi:MAG: protein kinase [Myxococcales bacterium]|nr:protein kinase [Myxococcales bacterium]